MLVCTDDARQFGDITPAAFAELGTAVGDIETASKLLRPWQKINYLMLMMVDPDVHFHVLPRYEAEQVFEEVSFADSGWPGPPDLASAVNPDAALTASLIARLKSHWPQS